MAAKKFSHPDDGAQEFIFRPYITRNGVRIYRKNGGMFRIPVKKKA